MKIKALTAGLLIFAIKVMGQIPENYYAPAENLSSYELKTALYQIIKDHTVRSYTSLWTYFEDTDQKNDGTVWDMYSDIPGGTPSYAFTFFTDQCGNYSGEGDCYNREHSFPKSWFGDASPMYTDLFHLYPTDGYVNGMRGNYPFGEVTSPTKTSSNGSKLGPCSYPGYTGVVFEPIDVYKGDFARSYFYMATRYENIIDNWENYDSNGDVILDGSSDKVFEPWFLNLLLDWHHQDPVSTKETNRNNEIYTIQGNRNPFIDHPEYVDCIWLNECSSTPDTTVYTDTCGTYIEIPSSDKNPMWIEEWLVQEQSGTNDTIYIFYTLSGDTTLHGTTWYKLYKSLDTLPTAHNTTYLGAMKTDSCGKIWYIKQDVEYLLYDFSKNEDDSIFYTPINQTTANYLIVNKKDSVLLEDGFYHMTFTFKNSNNIWIEGVGDSKSLLWSSLPVPDCNDFLKSKELLNCETVQTNLNCFTVNNETIYKNCTGDCYKLDDQQEPTDTILPKHDTCIQCMRFPESADNPVWAEEWILNDLSDNQDTTYIFYTLSGDTIINDTAYSKLMKSIGHWPAAENLEYVGGLRSDTCGHVWFIQDNQKYLLFDFSGLPGDTIFYQPIGQDINSYLIVQSVDSAILKDMAYHNIITFKNTENVWIEGIGDINSFLWNAPMTDCYSTSLSVKGTNCGTLATKLNCFYSDNELIFKNCIGNCYKEDPTSVATVKDDNTVNKKLFNVYPQPADNALYISFKNQKSGTVRLISVTGVVVKEVKRFEPLMNIDISDLQPGLYFISVMDEDNSNIQIEKIIIMHQ